MSNKLLDMLAKKKAAMNAGRDDFRPFRPKTGKTTIMILPPWRAEDEEGHDYQFWHDFAQHWIKAGADQKIQAVYTCPEKTLGIETGGECEVCAAIYAAKDYAKQLGDESIENLVGEAYANQQYLINVLVLSHEDKAQRTVPVTMSVGKTVMEQIISVIENYGEEDIAIFGEEKGVPLIIERTGSGREGTKYTTTPHAKGLMKYPALTGEVPNLDEIVKAQIDRNVEAKALNGVAKAVGLPAPEAGTPAASNVPGLAAPADETSLLDDADISDAEVIEDDPEEVKTPEASSADAEAEEDLDDMLAEFDV